MGGFVIVDGIDGSGKSVMISALKQWAKDQRFKILDLDEYCKEHKQLPEPEEIENYDVIISKEPSPAYMGRAIADEIVKDNKRDYSVESTAWAFALDREILYRRVIIPAMKAGKYIFQERGVVTSIVYQPVQGRMSLKDIVDMPGNKLALKNSPDLLIIAKVEPQLVITRLQRDGKIKEAIFRNLNLQRKLDERYSSSWLKSLFERFDSQVEYLDVNPPKDIEQVKQETVKVWEEFLVNRD